ncbi:MAG: TlpA disulfide reductase family protein [Pedobacter sp.]
MLKEIKNTSISINGRRAKGIGTSLIRSVFRLSIFGFIVLNSAYAQNNEYDKAISKFTGDRKYDIELPGSMDGVLAPEFEGTTLGGKPIRLSKLKGKVVVLNFWFIACVPCRLEITPLNTVVQQFKGKDVVFLSIAREKESDLKKHLESTSFLFQTIADPNSAIGNKTFHLFGYPTTLVIDKTGKIRYYALGGKINEEAVHKELQHKLVPVISNYLNKD